MNQPTKYALYALGGLFLLGGILNAVDPEVKESNTTATGSSIEYTGSNITGATQDIIISTGTTESTGVIEEQKPDCFSAWDGSVRSVENLIIDSMNDPDSYKHVSTKSLDDPFSDNRVIITEYRGKNAYGGVVKETSVIGIDDYCNVTKVYTEKEIEKIANKLNKQ